MGIRGVGATKVHVAPHLPAASRDAAAHRTARCTAVSDGAGADGVSRTGAHGIGHGHARGVHWNPFGNKAVIRSWRLPHRTLRYLHNSSVINNLREQGDFSFPIPFPISIWTQSHSAGLSEPTGDGWRIGLHSPDGLPAALVPLLELVPDLVVLMDAAQRRARAACSSIEQPR